MTTILVSIFIFILLLVIWALFGKGGEQDGSEQENIPDVSQPQVEAPLRRRATDKPDQAQESAAAKDQGDNLFRRKEDIDAIEDNGEVEDDFNLPYTAEEIIPEGSKHWVYNKTLANSEIYAKKGDFPTAISLYKGVYERVIDQNINSKIKANVDYLQEYQKHRLQKKTEELRQQAISQKLKSREVKVSFDAPVGIPDNIRIALSPPAPKPDSEPVLKSEMKEIADTITEKIISRQVAESGRTAEIEKYRTEVVELRKNVDQLLESKESAEASRIESLNTEIMGIKDRNEELTRLIKEIPRSPERTTEVREIIREREPEQLPVIEDADRVPSTIESKFQVTAPVPHIHDSIPKQEAPLAKKVDLQRKRQAEEDEPGEIELLKQPGEEKGFREPSEQDIEAVLNRDTHVKEEEPEEIELLSHKDEEEYTGPSDQDIFEKILSENKHKEEDSPFEILGYNKKHDDYESSFVDREQEEKEKEEERFYRKFLSQGKRVRKELPVLKVSYDFSKLPDEFSLSRDQNILQYSFFKYKPMLEKANELIKRRNVRDAINYYHVVKDQNIPPEFKIMLERNIIELTEYIEKYLAAD